MIRNPSPLVQAFLERGGKITVCPPGSGFTSVYVPHAIGAAKLSAGLRQRRCRKVLRIMGGQMQPMTSDQLQRATGISRAGINRVMEVLIHTGRVTFADVGLYRFYRVAPANNSEQQSEVA